MKKALLLALLFTRCAYAQVTVNVLAVTHGGTGTNNGSITGTGALTLAASGVNKNVTLTPSGSGYTLLNGNVGIGTTVPSYPLQVNGAISAGAFSAASGTRLDTYFVNFQQGDQAGGMAAPQYQAAMFIYNRNSPPFSGDIVFATNDTGLSTTAASLFANKTRMTISYNGNVGIGTTTPAQILDVNGNLALGGVLVDSKTVPTLTGFGTAPSVIASSGTAAFEINVGTGGLASTGTITFPLASHGWAVHCDDVTTSSASVSQTQQTAFTTTTAVVTQFSDVHVATAWVAGDILVCQARAF